jgi:hypothetical protein
MLSRSCNNYRFKAASKPFLEKEKKGKKEERRRREELPYVDHVPS